MSDYQSNITLDQAAQRLLGAQSMLITTHAKPDGDAFGAAAALASALRRLGKEVYVVVIPPLLASFDPLAGRSMMCFYQPEQHLPAVEMIVVLDTGAWGQLAPMDAKLRGQTERMMVIDHHISGDVPAAWRYIDVHAAACCEIVAQLLDRLEVAAGRGAGELYDATVSEALFVGLASDTGWFRFSNTRPETHELAARLLRLGVDHARLYEILVQSERIEKLKLLVRALGGLELLAGGRAAVMVLRGVDFVETGALLEETEKFVDLPRLVGTVDVVALITETPPSPAGSPGRGGGSDADAVGAREPGVAERGAKPPVIRISFRSKPGPGAVDVAQLAQRFGGGGHARAAGAKATAPLSEVVQQVKAALNEVLAAPSH